MPTYRYKCLKCEHEFEVFHAMSAEGPGECPKCQSPKEFLEKIIHAVGSILKGRGWFNKGGY